MTDSRRVAILGLGYIGLPTAAVLASRGWTVDGIDTNPRVVESINRGEAHIAEPDIDAMVRSAVDSGKLAARSSPGEADVFMICVPTPFIRDTSPPQPDLDAVFAAARAIRTRLRPGNLVIIESTCPVGTTEEVRDALVAEGLAAGVRFAYCPERVLPGRIFAELVANDRVIGGVDDDSAHAAAEFYGTFVEGSLFTTDSRTAEMVKLTENSFRDVNIAFANELSVLCDAMGIDPWRLVELANHHPRVQILRPGPGVGGHCIAVDPWFIVAGQPDRAPLIRMARQVNDAKPGWVVDKIAEAANGLRIDDRPVRVACFGLSYKADIDDLRESPAERIALALVARGYEVIAVEPNISDHASLELYDADVALDRADLVVLLVGHREFGELAFEGEHVLDFCGALAPGPATLAAIRGARADAG